MPGAGPSSSAKKVTLVDAFRDPRWALMAGLGFCSGLPNPLSHSTLKAWLTATGVDMTTIGLFAYVRLPYTLKFLWAPLIDRYRLPFLSRRRGYIAVFQVALTVAVGVMGFLDPVKGPWLVAAMALIVAFSSASLDVAADAYRTEYLPLADRADGTAIWVAAYRMALIVAGAGALFLSDHVPWSWVYWIMAALVAIGVVVTLLAPPSAPKIEEPKTFRGAVVDPFKSFLKRDGAIRFLVIIMLYRLGEIVIGHYRLPALLRALEFTRSELAVYDKALGLGFTILGAMLLVGGGFVKRWGLKRTLIVMGIAQAVTNALYALLAAMGKNYLMLIVAISVDNLTNGMGTAVFSAFLMTLCDKKFAAFQFALFSSMMVLVGLIVSGVTGWMPETLGWPGFFLSTVFLGFPALVLLYYAPVPEHDEAPPDDEAADDEKLDIDAESTGDG